MFRKENRLLSIEAIIAILALFGWANNWILLTSIKPIYVPMAPLAAFLIFFTSLAYAYLFSNIKHKIVSKSICYLVLINILIATFSLVDYFLLLDWNFEQVFFANMISEV